LQARATARTRGVVAACIVASGGGAVTCGGSAACVITNGGDTIVRIATNCNGTTTHVATRSYQCLWRHCNSQLQKLVTMPQLASLQVALVMVPSAMLQSGDGRFLFLFFYSAVSRVFNRRKSVHLYT